MNFSRRRVLCIWASAPVCDVILVALLPGTRTNVPPYTVWFISPRVHNEEARVCNSTDWATEDAGDASAWPNWDLMSTVL